MPLTSFVPAAVFDWPAPSASVEGVCAPAPPKPRGKPGPKGPRPKPPKPKGKGKGRELATWIRDEMGDRLEEATLDGRIELNHEDMPCEQLDLTHGELELLMKVLLPEGPELVAELRAMLARVSRKGSAGARTGKRTEPAG